MTTFVRSSAIAIALVATLLTSLIPQPALADGRASTRNIIIAGAALLLGAAAISNANHRRSANQVVGYLDDGSTVYSDGRIDDGDGNVWYPGDRGMQVACNGQRCRLVRANTGSRQDEDDNNENRSHNNYSNSGRYENNGGGRHHHRDHTRPPH